MFVQKLFKFIVRNGLHNQRFLIQYLRRYWQSGFTVHANFYSTKELQDQLAEGKSLVRFGDGEIQTINYDNVHYQAFDHRLRDYLLELCTTYTNESAYIIGIPQTYISMPNQALRERGMLRCWLPFKIIFTSCFNNTATYFDAHQFYRDQGFESLIIREIKDKPIVIVTKQSTIDTLKNTVLPSRHKTTFVETPSRDTFAVFTETLEKILQAVEANPDARVLLGAGPASKALVYELVQRNIVSYDIGKGIETLYQTKNLETEI